MIAAVVLILIIFFLCLSLAFVFGWIIRGLFETRAQKFPGPHPYSAGSKWEQR